MSDPTDRPAVPPRRLTAAELQWGTYVTKIDGRDARVGVNLALASAAPDVTKPTLLVLRWPIPHADAHGLASDDSLTLLTTIEDRCEDLLSPLNAAHVARIECGGEMDLYFYLATDAPVEAALATLAAESAGTMRPQRVDDPRWRTYRHQLLPDPRARRGILNRIAIDRLQDLGDEIRSPRKVEHFMRFPRATDAKAFAAEATHAGWTVLNAETQPGDPRPILVVAEQMHSLEPADVDAHVESIAAIGTRHDGEHDGWQTAVDSPRDGASPLLGDGTIA